MGTPALLLLLDTAADSAGTATTYLNGANVTSFIITFVLIVGVFLSYNRKIHPPIMVGCFLADVGLVIWLEVTREAVETATGNMSALMVTHIALAMSMLVLYVLMLLSGLKLLRAPANSDSLAIRRRHKFGAILFFVVRVAVLVTAMMVASDVRHAAPVTPGTGQPPAGPAEPLPHRITTRDGTTVP
jgi:hypothetical protein